MAVAKTKKQRAALEKQERARKDRVNARARARRAAAKQGPRNAQTRISVGKKKRAPGGKGGTGSNES